MPKLLDLFLFPLALLAAGCGNAVLTGPSALGGGVWRLRSMQLADMSVLVIAQPERYTAEFGDAGRLSVRADCNICGGAYQTSGGSLQLQPLACTRVFCGDASLDTRYLTVLAGATSHEVREGVLSIFSSQGMLRCTR